MLLNLNFIRLTHIIGRWERVYMFCDCQKDFDFGCLEHILLKGQAAERRGDKADLFKPGGGRRGGWEWGEERWVQKGTEGELGRWGDAEQRFWKVRKDGKGGGEQGRDPACCLPQEMCVRFKCKQEFSLFECESVAIHRAAWPAGEQIFLFLICMYAG